MNGLEMGRICSLASTQYSERHCGTSLCAGRKLQQSGGVVKFNHGCFHYTFSIVHNLLALNRSKDPVWKRIWKAPTPQKIRFFLWLVAQDRIMTNANRKSRNLTHDPSCKAYDNLEETTLQLIRDCKMARQIWEQIIPSRDHVDFFSLPFHI